MLLEFYLYVNVKNKLELFFLANFIILRIFGILYVFLMKQCLNNYFPYIRNHILSRQFLNIYMVNGITLLEWIKTFFDITEEPIEPIRPIIPQGTLVNNDQLVAPRYLHPSCNICHEQYDSRSELRMLQCEHYFHKDCIDPWLVANHNKCPIC
jgi:hypothetical protein